MLPIYFLLTISIGLVLGCILEIGSGNLRPAKVLAVTILYFVSVGVIVNSIFVPALSSFRRFPVLAPLLGVLIYILCTAGLNVLLGDPLLYLTAGQKLFLFSGPVITGVWNVVRLALRQRNSSTV